MINDKENDTTTPYSLGLRPRDVSKKNLTSHNESERGGIPHTQSWLEESAVDHIPQALFGTNAPCFGGIFRDYQMRSHFLKSDIIDGLSFKTISAGLFMFCATVTSTVALGNVLYYESNGKVGITEYLVLQSVSGMFHAMFSACPLPVLRPTGPITAFMIDLYGLSETLNVDYYALISWVGCWVGTFLIIIAALDLARYIALCTRFLHDIYAVFVCTIYISDGIIGMWERFDLVEWDQAFFAFYLALFCILFSLAFHYMDRMSIFTPVIRQVIADYAVPLAVVLCVWVSYSVKDHVSVARIALPRNLEPTYYDEDLQQKRSWFQGISGSNNDDGSNDTMTLAIVSAIASIPIVALFYIDHLFSCILGQKSELGLQKGEYYHSSLFITGICNLVLPSFGLPFVTASLPHSPQFIKSLTDYDKSCTPWKVIHVHESRLAPMLVYALCFTCLVVPSFIEMCPEGVVNGILTFVGLQGILPGTGNQLIDRCVLLLTGPSQFSNLQQQSDSQAPYAELPWRRVHLYTFLQLVCLAACWGMRFTGPFALAFPLVIVGFVPLRLMVLPKIFSEFELSKLDAGDSSSSSDSSSGDEFDGGKKMAPIIEDHYTEMT
mmetsp:Transcript_29619/g.34070  ORF Transcript_29619/g.34070 Transcript_29619/m.34070 type:complete len:607 (-) Transcript_29619:47-1867(-)